GGALSRSPPTPGSSSCPARSPVGACPDENLIADAARRPGADRAARILSWMPVLTGALLGATGERAGLIRRCMLALADHDADGLQAVAYGSSEPWPSPGIA